METKRRRVTIVASALVAAGAVMVAIGAGIETEEIVQVLTILGAGLVAAGLALILRASPMSYRQSAVVGAVLLITGTVTTVFGGSANAANVQASVTAIGGALFVPGLIELVLGTSQGISSPVEI